VLEILGSSVSETFEGDGTAKQICAEFESVSIEGGKRFVLWLLWN
jgi:hypothetical protein